MPAFNNTVEFISIKPLANPDRYGNTFRASIKMGEEWYSWGQIKKEQISFNTGRGWHDLKKGDTIEGMFKVNGDFKNIQPKTVSLVSAGEGGQAPAPSQQASKPQQQQQQSGGSFVNPAALGNAGNYLMHTLEFTHEDMMDDAKVTEGLVKYHKSREQLSKFWEKAEKLAKEDKPPFTPTKKKATKAEPEYDEELDMGYDDDLPI